MEEENNYKWDYFRNSKKHHVKINLNLVTVGNFIKVNMPATIMDSGQAMVGEIHIILQWLVKAFCRFPII